MGTVENDTAAYYQRIDQEEAKQAFIEEKGNELYKQWLAEYEATDYIEYLDLHADDIRDIMETKGFLCVETLIDIEAQGEAIRRFNNGEYNDY